MKIVTLDLSTTATGWATFTGDKLETYGVLKPKLLKEQKKMVYPIIQILKMRSLSAQIYDIIKEDDYQYIIIEEINRGKNRLGQKTLDGLHWVLINLLWQNNLAERVLFFDSDGKDGWRSARGLKLQLSPQDKLLNKGNKKLNKKLAKKDHRPVVTQKTLCCRFVNKAYDLALTEKDNDIADAIGLGHFFLHHVWKMKKEG